MASRILKLGLRPSQEDSDGDIRGPLGLQQLSASSEPMVDIIFVHGLRGGSVKTWQKGSDPELFWPQHWLPNEPEFRNASIYSFGYEANWKSSQPSILSIHDFGQALYEEMRSSPLLRLNTKCPIILVGHSMGGLVIKKAHILAYRSRDSCDIWDRIRSIFFLATPHKGSEYAAVLNNVLKLSGFTRISSSRDYIDDLKVGSKSTQLINEEFGQCIADLSIFSFYETLQTKIGPSSTIIVSKDSAVLGPGHQNERVTYLNANHGNMCKFRDRKDPNYLTVKNALGSVAQRLSENIIWNCERLASHDLRSIRVFLGTSDYLENHYDRIDETCEWIDEREDYKAWRDNTSGLGEDKTYRPSLFWVIANPGAGKTVLVTHVESQLEEMGHQHSAYYFHVGNKEANSLAGLLRFLAYKMATLNTAVREKLMEIQNQSPTFDLDDSRAIWTMVFRSGIFQIPIQEPQYWLVDALDECATYIEFFSLLRVAPIAFPLKIFMTSRKMADMPKLVRQLNDITLRLVDIPIQDTMRDIQLYISKRISDLPIDNEAEITKLQDNIINKSNASFLWVRLVMDQLESIYGYESIMETLQNIPEGMVPYYQRIVTEMAQNDKERHVAKAILEWVCLAARPLSTIEVANALSIDIKTQLSSPKAAIGGLCGHLVSVNAESDHIRIVHLTAREFLFSGDADYFRISTTEAHRRIALACLKVLCGPEMKPPKHKQALERKCQEKEVPPLLDYAVSYFSDHVLQAGASSDELFAALFEFLSSNTFTWIDKVSTKGEIHYLIRTSRNLKAYLDQRAEYRSHQDRQFQCVESWTTDLIRVAIKFHSALMTYPQSIYFLIPPLCPTDSAIHRQFRKTPDSLTLLGPNNQHWDDCVATLDFGKSTVADVSCGQNLIAVSFESGEVSFYNNRCQEVDLFICNDLSIDLLQFDSQGSFMAGSGRRFVKLWDLRGNLLWGTQVKARLFLLTFSLNYVIGITEQGKVLKWDIKTGEVVQEQTPKYQLPEDDDTSYSVPSRAPCAASISPDLEFIALAYRNGPVCLFDLESAGLIGWALDVNKRCPRYLIFNPNSDLDLLLVIYDESHMSLFDPSSGALLKKHDPEKHIIPISATCSPSGRTFATADIQGNLRVWDFESLTVLYHIMTPNHSFRILKFTSDNFTLLDVTDHEMKVWTPPALIRNPVEDDASCSTEPRSTIVPKGNFEALQLSRTMTFMSHPRHSSLFVGKNNGEVTLYGLKDGKQKGTLYAHQDTVAHIASCRENVIASSDLFHIVQVWTLTVRRPNIIQAERLNFKTRAAAPIRQLVLDDSGEYLLVSTTRGDFFYRTSNGMMVSTIDWDQDQRTTWKWIAMPDHGQGSVFALIHNRALSYYTVSSSPRARLVPVCSLEYPIDEGCKESSMDVALLNPSTMHLVLQYTQQSRRTTHSTTAIFQLPPLTGEELSTVPHMPDSSGPSLLFHELKFALGFTSFENTLIFLHKDSWVCSITIDSKISHYTRHFFVPHEYTATNNGILPLYASGDSLVFSLFARIAIFKNGLKFKSQIAA